MSYFSSSLDDSFPVWTAYSPKAGISWAPRVTHVYDDEDEEDFQGDHRPHPLTRRASSIGLYGSLVNVLGAVSNAIHTPKLGRRGVKGSAGNNDRTAKFRARAMSESALSTQRLRERIQNRNSDGTIEDATDGFPLGASRITESRESLPSVNSDGTKSSSDSPSGSTKGIFSFWETPGPYGTPKSQRLSLEDRFPPDGFLEVEEQSSCGDSIALEEEDCYTEPHEKWKAVNIQDLVCQDVSAISIDRRNIRTGRLIVREAHRSVCCGSLRSTCDGYTSYTRQVSIHIYRGLNTKDEQVTLLRNMAALRRLRHPHVMGLFGMCMEGAPVTPDGTEAMVLTPRTHFHLTLRRLLIWTRENNPKLLTPGICVTFGLHMCQGLLYLEKQRVLHSNLTTATVLLDSQGRCKLFDIEIQPLEKRSLNTRWLPLETFLQSLYNYKAVAWSFGVVLWEIASLAQEPYPHLSAINDIILYLAHGKRLIRPDNCPRRLYSIMLACWSEKPRSRPTFEDLIITLTSCKQTLPIDRPVEEVFPDKDDFWEDRYM